MLCLELLNSKAPSAWLLPSAAAAASDFPDRLAELASDCLTCGEVLVARADDLDLIFLPRRPAKPDAGGSFMCVFGNVAAVVYHASLLCHRQVGGALVRCWPGSTAASAALPEQRSLLRPPLPRLR